MDDDTSRAAPSTPSNGSFATANTASGSISIRRRTGNDGDRAWQADEPLRKRADPSLISVSCKTRNAVWFRIADSDGRLEEKGTTNRYDGCGWIRLCPGNSEGYEAWAISHNCTTRGRPNVRRGTVASGMESSARMERFDVPVYQFGPKPYKEEENASSMSELERVEFHGSQGGPASDRAMKLRKRALRRDRTPKRTPIQDIVVGEGGRSNYRESRRSKGSA